MVSDREVDLFRRLVSYFKVRNVGVAKFEEWLRDGHDDELWIVSEAELGNLHDMFIVSDGRSTWSMGLVTWSSCPGSDFRHTLWRDFVHAA